MNLSQMNSIDMQQTQRRLEKTARAITALLEELDPIRPGSIFTGADLRTLYGTQALIVNKIERQAETITRELDKERKALESIQGTHVNGTS